MIVAFAVQSALGIDSTIELSAQESSKEPISYAIGKLAPELELTPSFNVPSDVSKFDLELLRGKVVVLEFWTTSCGPCIAAIPHLNDLVNELVDKIQIISITHENKETVKRYVEKYQIKAWVGLDTNKATWRRYKVNQVPTTVIIDREGKVSAITVASNVTKQLLIDIYNNGSGKFANEIASVKVSRNITGQSSSAIENTQYGILYRNMRPISFLKSQFPNHEIVGSDALPEARFDFRLNLPTQSRQKTQGMSRAILESTFNVTLEEKDIEIDVLKMKILKGQFDARKDVPAQNSISSTFSHAKGIYKSNAASPKQFAGQLSHILGKKVITSNAFNGAFEIDLKWDPSMSHDEIGASISKALGIKLTPARVKRPALLINESQRDGK